MIPVEQTLTYLQIQFEVRDRNDAWALCPLHEEVTPSFHVDLVTGRWKCYGCGQGGSFEELVTRIVHDPLAAIAVIHRARGLAPASVISRDERAHADLCPVDPLVGWRRLRKVDWMNVPLENPVAEYMVRNRGFTRETLDLFDARFTEWSEYPVAFQIHDGVALVGYARRRIDSGQPKYRYNAGFHGDSSVAYYSADSGASCLIVEGILDLMMAAQFGYPRVAALLGWRLSEPKYEKLRSLGVERVVCATDNDKAGAQGWEMVRARFAGARRFEFPPHRKDVGEMKQHEFLVGLP